MSAYWRICALITLLMLVAAVASADSDGLYCVGPRYIAYQFGMDSPHGLHQVTIVRLGGPEGIAKPDVIEMPVAQVDWMRCSNDRIEIRLFKELLVIPLDGELRPLAITRSPQADPPMGRIERNLGPLSRAVGTLKPERVELLVDSTGHQFVLEMLPRDVQTLRCMTELQTRIIELDRQGRQVRERQVHREVYPRSCGE